VKYPSLDRNALKMKPLSERPNRVVFERDKVLPGTKARAFAGAEKKTMNEAIGRIVGARKGKRPVMLAFGAHLIKNCLSPVLIRLMEKGWVTHLATNGAGVIHDWELAFQGGTSEAVRANVARGEFGNWEETGYFINLAINVGAYEGRGYGEAVGAFIENEGLEIPSASMLEGEAVKNLKPDPARAAAAADLLEVVSRFDLKPGFLRVPHPFKHSSAQAAAHRLGIPFTSHPMFGQDIIYNHGMNRGSAIGRAAERDFLTFADGVSRLDGGVYISVGSAVMSPMIFEKSFSMGQNLALQRGAPIRNHYMLVVDIAESRWDWSRGEPPENTPDYYHRFCKSFYRMGGAMRYISADNRDFLPALLAGLEQSGG